ncbi:MAG: efflux RND transporter permease subunit [Bacteroidetes bacterium]|nr:efflux RND transporter permease subunit [Bacteroidota bacterium]
MGLTRLAINRPLAILMLIIALVLMGVVSFRLLRVDRMPQMSFPFVSVSVSYPGASPTDMEALVAEPIEGAVAGVAGVQSIQSSTSLGRASVNIQFVEGVDTDKAAVDVQNRVAGIRSRLPADATDPRVGKFDPNSSPIMNIAFTGPRSSEELYDIASTEVQPALQSVLGVADVSMSGGRQEEIEIQLDLNRLEGYGVTIQQLTTALGRENVNVPAGSVTQGRQTLSVRSLGLFQSPDDLGNMIVSTSVTGTVRLKDVSTIVDTYKPRTAYQRFDGNDSIGLAVTKASEANSLQVASDLRDAVDKIQQTLPADTKLVISNDSSRFTQAALDAVQKDLLMAVLLCGAVLLLFLHTWRNTLIVILAIPTSLISTFLVMYALGFSLNTMSLLALALMIGILVDDSIVVLENIHRHLTMGEKPRDAALNGRSEIGMAAMAITFVDIVVYVPVAFMQGNVGRMFKEYGLTIAAATLFSLFVSFTLTPMLASRFAKREEHSERGLWARFGDAWDRGFQHLADGYGQLVGFALHVRPLVLVVGFGAVAIALAMLQFNVLGSEYAPQEDDNLFNINIQMPSGTSLDTTNAATVKLEKLLRDQVPEATDMFTTVGSRGAFGGTGANANISVQLVDKSQRSRTIWQIMADVRRLAATIPEMNAQVNSSGGIAGMGRGGNNIMIRVSGPDLDTLAEIASQVQQIAQQVPGIADVRNAAAAVSPEFQAVLDRKKMAEMGITANQVGTTLRTLISGSVVTQYQPEGKTQMDITLITSNSGTQSVTQIANVPVAFQNGVPIRLGQIATIKQGTGPTQINRQDRNRVVSLSAVVVGRSTGDVARDLRAQLQQYSLPPGYAVTLAGSVTQMETTFSALLSALVLSIIMIYMLMVALYESWMYPLAIMFSLPVSLVGAFGGLLLTGNTFNLFSLIGIIMLMGLVAKNAILLVDYTNTLRARGMERNRALMEAGRTRLRPILMTTSTIVAAMIPLALKMEAGAESRSPMAVVVIGGVVSSTLLTLVLVPVMYTILDGLQVRLSRRQPSFELLPEVAGAPIGGGAPTGPDNGGPNGSTE